MSVIDLNLQIEHFTFIYIPMQTKAGILFSVLKIQLSTATCIILVASISLDSLSKSSQIELSPTIQ